MKKFGDKKLVVESVKPQTLSEHPDTVLQAREQFKKIDKKMKAIEELLHEILALLDRRERK